MQEGRRTAGTACPRSLKGLAIELVEILLAGGQEFRERIPIVLVPSGSQSFPGAFREAGVVEDELGRGALFDELEFRDRVKARVPVRRRQAWTTRTFGTSSICRP